MGWTLRYALLRSTPLTDTERLAVARFVVQLGSKRWSCEPFALELPAAARADGVVARGMTKVGENRRAKRDAERVLAALGELQTRLGETTRVQIDDDYDVVGLDAAGRPAFTGQPSAAPCGDSDDGAWLAARAVIPPPPLALPAKLQALVAAFGSGAAPDLEPFLDERNIGRLFAALDKLPNDDPREPVLMALLARLPAPVVARAGLAAFPALANGTSGTAFSAALDRLPDVAAITPEFFAAWAAPAADGTRLDLVTRTSYEFRARFVAQPAVQAQLVAEVDERLRAYLSDAAGDHLEAALALLAEARSAEALRAIVRVVASFRQRTRDGLGAATWSAYRRALAALGESGEPRVAPTLLLVLDERDRMSEGLNGEALEGLVRLLGAEAAPVVERLLDAGFDEPWAYLHAADHLPAAEAERLLERLLAWPRAEMRQCAALGIAKRHGARGVALFAGAAVGCPSPPWHMLEAAGEPAPADPTAEAWLDWLALRGLPPQVPVPMPPAVERLALPAARVRAEARTELHEARDPSTAQALALAEIVEYDEQKRLGLDAGIPLFWGRWGEPFRQLGATRPRDWQDWFAAHAAELPTQVVPTALRELAAGGDAARAAAWPGFRLSDAERAAAEKAEAAFLGGA